MAVDKLLIYFESEEPIVRRLGAAVVSCWADLPDKVKKKLLDRVSVILDTEPDAEDLDRKVKAFIASHGGR